MYSAVSGKAETQTRSSAAIGQSTRANIPQLAATHQTLPPISDLGKSRSTTQASLDRGMTVWIDATQAAKVLGINGKEFYQLRKNPTFPVHRGEWGLDDDWKTRFLGSLLPPSPPAEQATAC
jgi:hypothetical protein